MSGKDNWKAMTMSSGVTVRYGQFPGSLYWDVMAKAFEDHPDPEVPQREIEVLGGTEMVDDEENPEYKVQLQVARNARFDLVGKMALELCVEPVGWPDEWVEETDRLVNVYGAKLDGKVPETDTERRLAFLMKYAIRTADDWEVIGKIRRFSQIEEEDVRRQAETFPGDVEEPESSGPDAPGAVEGDGMAVHGEGA
jgi:hypothetical protein